jgi:hypothetical protein
MDVWTLDLDGNRTAVVQYGTVHLGKRRCCKRDVIELGVQLLWRRTELGDYPFAGLLVGEYCDITLQQLEFLLPFNGQGPGLARDDLTNLDVRGTKILEQEPKTDRRWHTYKRNVGFPQPRLEASPESGYGPVAIKQRIDTVDLEHLAHAEQAKTLLCR